MANLSKTNTSKNFSKYAATYKQYAGVQFSIVNELLSKYKPKKKYYKSILDIGCGTGFTIDKLLYSNLFWDQFYAVDFAEGMVRECENKYKGKNINIINADIEDFIKAKNTYDLVLSCSTIHWLKNQKNFFEKLYNNMSNNSEIVFSTFGPNTYKELYSLIDSGFSIPNYLSMDNYQKMLAEIGFTNINLSSRSIVQNHESAISFLNSIKLSGTKINDSMLGLAELKQLISRYNKKYSCKKGVYATYDVIYFRADKRV